MNRPFTINEEIFINQFSQRIHTLKTMEKWFDKYSVSDKRNIILNLLGMVIQAHPTYEEISLAVDKLGKKSSPSAVKLLNKSRPYNKYGYEISNLPEYELINAFDILLVVLSISDNRRRLEECSNGCNHWWHMDLSDKAVVQWLRQNYS